MINTSTTGNAAIMEFNVRCSDCVQVKTFTSGVSISKVAAIRLLMLSLDFMSAPSGRRPRLLSLHVCFQKFLCLFQVQAILIWPGNFDRKFTTTVRTYSPNLRRQLIKHIAIPTFSFCQYMRYSPFPVQPDHLLQYASFLARSLKARLYETISIFWPYCTGNSAFPVHCLTTGLSNRCLRVSTVSRD